jgi:anti-anti-sigma factor
MTGGGGGLSVVVTRTGAAAQIQLTGVLDVATVDVLQARVRAEIAEGAALVVELSGVRMCDSAGIGALVRLNREALAAGATLALRSPRRHVAGVLAMTGINRIISVLPD